MKILYIHGFGSQFDVNSNKCSKLTSLGEVVGITLDYTTSFEQVKSKLLGFIKETPVDIIIGTSLGGFWSSIIGTTMQLPFVAINPATTPQNSLKKYQGKGKTYYGSDIYLSEEVISGYQKFSLTGNGLIFLDLADEVIDSSNTLDHLNEFYTIHCFEGGNHRFAHIDESLPLIRQFYKTINCC